MLLFAGGDPAFPFVVGEEGDDDEQEDTEGEEEFHDRVQDATADSECHGQVRMRGGVRSTPYVPLRDIVAFIAVINETIRPYLASKGHSADEVDGMHRAWCRSMQIQIALWSRPYAESNQAPDEW